MFDLTTISAATLMDLEYSTCMDASIRAETLPNYEAVCKELTRRGLSIRDLSERAYQMKNMKDFDPFNPPELERA